MSHGITATDVGMVGFADVYGGCWHKLEQYKTKDGAVTLQEAQAVLGYEVVKIPLGICMMDGNEKYVSDDVEAAMLGMNGKLVAFPDLSDGGVEDGLLDETDGRMYGLFRLDTKQPVFRNSVSSSYKVLQNVEFLEKIDQLILQANPDIQIESVGTLWGGRVTFVNIILAAYKVAKDSSMTVDRIMYHNAFGGMSVGGCAHSTRIVCNNTFRNAQAQGAANQTLKKFRHTGNAVGRVAAHMVDLSGVKALMAAQREKVEQLVTMPMNGADVKNFLGNLYPITAASSKNERTRRETLRMNVEVNFDKLPDLQGDILHTRYSMLQAVTNYNQNPQVYSKKDKTLIFRKGSDAASAWWDVATGAGKDVVNQSAFTLLTNPTIPEYEDPPMKAEVEELAACAN